METIKVIGLKGGKAKAITKEDLKGLRIDSSKPIKIIKITRALRGQGD